MILDLCMIKIKQVRRLCYLHVLRVYNITPRQGIKLLCYHETTIAPPVLTLCMSGRGQAAVLGPITQKSLIRVLRYPRRGFFKQAHKTATRYSCTVTAKPLLLLQRLTLCMSGRGQAAVLGHITQKSVIQVLRYPRRGFVKQNPQNMNQHASFSFTRMICTTNHGFFWVQFPISNL